MIADIFYPIGPMPSKPLCPYFSVLSPALDCTMIASDRISKNIFSMNGTWYICHTYHIAGGGEM